MQVSSVGFLHELCDLVLTGEFEQAITLAMPIHTPSVRVHRSEFAAAYEACAQALHALTSHQQDAMAPVLNGKSARLEAPAGTGKSFLAGQRVVETLRSKQLAAKVLLIVQNSALCFWFATWIGKLVQDVEQYVQFLARLYVAFPPFQGGLQQVGIHGRKFQLSSVDVAGSSSLEVDLLVVDGAQHIYSIPEGRDLVEKWTGSQTTQLLLSDNSARVELDSPHTSQLPEVHLSQVIRSSKHIIAHALPFQLGGARKLHITCTHDSMGPRVESFLFVPQPQEQQEEAAEESKVPSLCPSPSLLQRYAEETALALRRVAEVV